ncbi:TonB-dependent receptor [Thiohalospira sp.]|uniref:TonB-dependent receptor n=1 Tax=Thiohalospira sp. TaxID=3080549 RepID=UPI00398156A7
MNTFRLSGARSCGATTSGLAAVPALVLGALSAPVAAQDGGAERLDAVQVTTTRTSQGRSIADIPGSVTVLEEEDLEEQTRSTDDLGEVLSNLVPGMGQSSENLTNYGQQLRGRKFLVMIDGVPQNAVLRDGLKHLRAIAPEAIERVEVVRGAVATYGIGSTGGVINFITKSGADAEGHENRTAVELTGQSENGDSLGGRLYQGMRGNSEALDYSLNVSAGETGVGYDGDGERIPSDGYPSQGGGLAESTELNLQSKVGYQVAPDQRLRLSLNYYDHTQDAEYSADPKSGGSPGNPSAAVNEAPEGDNPGTENLNVSLDHTWEDVAGGTLSTQVYHQDYETIFGYTDDYGQTFLETRHTGLRLAHERGFGALDAVYGLDAGTETTAQNFRDGRTNMGEFDQTNYAPFVQLNAPLGEDWMVRGGVRHERVTVDAPTFRDEGFSTSGTVTGGELDYDETVFNAGLVRYLSAEQELFASFSQGFTVAEIGRALRTQSTQGNDVDAEELNPEAQVVDNYELGWRGRFRDWRATATAFYNTSELGATFGGPPDYAVLRQEEEVYGAEFTGEMEAGRAWRLGGTATWQEGRVDTDDDGETDDYLDGTRITPPELTLHADYEPDADWSGRLQAKRVFDRERFGDSTTFAEGKVSGYTLVDATARFGAGPGKVSVGLRNLLDEQYMTPLSQSYNTPGYTPAGKGRSITLSYDLTY